MKNDVTDKRRARTIKMLALNAITPYESNAKIHTQEQVEMIADSITRYGFTNPIQLDEHGVIIAGHGRYAAALYLNLEKVPTVLIDYLSVSEVAKLRLADNRLAELSDWNPTLLATEFIDLGAADDKFAALDLGFDDKFLGKLGIGDGAGDEARTANLDDDTKEHLLVIDCKGETEQQALYEEFHERGLKVKIME